MSNLEIAANVMTALCIFLAGRNNVHTWWVGIVATVLFGVLFFESKLYADTLLQVFFVGTGIIGWMNWKTIDKEIGSVRGKQIRAYLVIAIISAAIYGTILYEFTDAFAPGIDSVVLTFSILGQILLMRRQKETWIIWLVVNTLAVPLFYSRELYLTTGMYSLFWFHALYSWYSWKLQYEDRFKLTYPKMVK